MKKRWQAHCLCLGILSLALARPVAAQSAASMQSAQALGEDLYVRSGSTGLALVVVRGNQTTIETFGETSPGSHQTPTPDSLLRLCSLTKIFTADLLVKLMQAKVVRLDTPLQTLAPAGRHVPLRDGRPITLLDLATHTAGLPRELGTAPRDTPHFTYPGPERRWAWLPAQRLRTTPGTAALYSNIGFDFLADALERAAHTPYPKLLAARTTKPLDMSETTFTPTPAQCARLLGTAHPEGPCTPTTNTDGSSGLYSTATDMARFLQYLLGTGGSADPTHPIPRQSAAAQAVYIDPASLASISGLDHAGDPTGIGLGWIHTAGSSLTGQSAVDIIEKTGGGAGFLTYIAMLPAQHIGIFVAATDGAVETHLNLFRNANNVLLSLAGLPTIYIPPRPEPPPRTRARARSPRQN